MSFAAWYVGLKTSRLRRLFLHRKTPYADASRLPRVIWMFWAEGADTAPDLIRASIASWRDRNPGWTVRVLALDTIPLYVTLPDLPADISFTQLSDVLRARLLKDHGGVWADATSICATPLDAWLPPLMGAEFFAFSQPHPNRVIARWFLAAHKGGAVISRLDAEIETYWRGRTKAQTYLWFHYLVEYLTWADRGFRHNLRDIPKISADGPHRLKRFLTADGDRVGGTCADLTGVPFHKLTRKADFDMDEVMRLVSGATPPQGAPAASLTTRP